MNWKRFFTPIGAGIGFISILILLVAGCLEIYYAGMSHVKAGQFDMGCAECLEREKPVHTVKLGGFWIDQFEVTNIQYVRFLNEGRADGWVDVNQVTLDDGTSYHQVEINGNPVTYLNPSKSWAQISYSEGVFITDPNNENLPVTVSWLDCVLVAGSLVVDLYCIGLRRVSG